MYFQDFFRDVTNALRPTTAKVWFVNSVTGNNNLSGRTPDKPKLTIAATVALAAAGDTIYIKGSFNEPVTCSLAGVSFIGVGTGPKQAQWTAPTAAGSWCLKIAANYVRVENIYFKPVIYTSSGVPSGIYLSGANWAVIKGCRFQGQTGSYKAIYSPVCDSDNVTIEDNQFYYMNTATHGAAIYGVEAGGLSYSGWQILNNVFESCVTAVDINGRVCVVKGNVFGGLTGITAASAVGNVCTTKLDLSGTSSGGNRVVGNWFGLTYSHSGGYQEAASGDDWVGNYIVGGLTTAVPS